MSYQAPPELEEADRRELLRIAHVYAKEWLRSGRRPPGSPHRASLLSPSAAWLRLAFGPPSSPTVRDELQLDAARPLWETVAALAAALVGHHPSPSAEQLAGARYQLLVLGEPMPLGRATDALVLDGPAHLAVVLGRRAALVTAAEARGRGADAAAQLAACCRALGHDDEDWRTAAAVVHAFPEAAVPLFESDEDARATASWRAPSR